MATDTTSPYSWNWDTMAFFKHTIKVIAYNTVGKEQGASLEVWKFF